MPRAIPQPLKIVAYLLLIFGVISAFDIVIALLLGRIKINLGILQIFVGIGLLQLNPNSLKWAMFLTWLWLLVTPILAMGFFLNSGNLNFLGRTVSQAPPGLGFMVSVAIFIFAYWQYHVLDSHEVRQSFAVR